MDLDLETTRASPRTAQCNSRSLSSSHAGRDGGVECRRACSCGYGGRWRPVARSNVDAPSQQAVGTMSRARTTAKLERQSGPPSCPALGRASAPFRRQREIDVGSSGLYAARMTTSFGEDCAEGRRCARVRASSHARRRLLRVKISSRLGPSRILDREPGSTLSCRRKLDLGQRPEDDGSAGNHALQTWPVGARSFDQRVRGHVSRHRAGLARSRETVMRRFRASFCARRRASGTGAQRQASRSKPAPRTVDAAGARAVLAPPTGRRWKMRVNAATASDSMSPRATMSGTG